MPRRAVPLISGHYYHLYNRGHNREPIFLEPDNYTFFLRQFRTYITGQHATVVAYALLPNHFHMLVRAQSDELSHAMQLLGISYTKAMNARFRRTGSIFEGAFEAKLVEQDAYLTHLSRYIHLNPVRLGLVSQAQDWVFSSYRDYVGLRQGSLPQPGVVLGQFADSSAYRDFVESYRPQDRAEIAAWWI
jgi:putative transposase